MIDEKKDKYAFTQKLFKLGKKFKENDDHNKIAGRILSNKFDCAYIAAHSINKKHYSQ